MAYFLSHDLLFDIMMYILTLSHTFWRHDILSILLDVVIYFLTSRRTFDIMIYLTYLFTSWGTFWHYGVRCDICFDVIYVISILFDIMTYIWVFNVLVDVMAYFWTLWRNLWHFDVLYSDVMPHLHIIHFDVMTYIFMSWRTFWYHDILSIFFDVMTYGLTVWHTFWSHEVLYYILSTSLHIFKCQGHVRRKCKNHIIVETSYILFEVMKYFIIYFRRHYIFLNVKVMFADNSYKCWIGATILLKRMHIIYGFYIA